MDECDLAQKFEERDREIALKKALYVSNSHDAHALMIRGKRCCCDCEEPLSEKRILANPRAARCTACQEIDEKKRRLS